MFRDFSHARGDSTEDILQNGRVDVGHKCWDPRFRPFEGPGWWVNISVSRIFVICGRFLVQCAFGTCKVVVAASGSRVQSPK